MRLTRDLEPPDVFRKPGAWFWIVAAVGAAIRLWLAIATTGTDDVAIWSEHASGVARHGLIEHYAQDPIFNHPPPAAWVMARAWNLAHALGISFAAIYRVPIALIDLAGVLLLVRVLAASAWRWIAAAVYLISPVALVLAGQHGNLDALIATCLLAAVLSASQGRAIATGAIIGLSAWIKLPGLLAAPAIGIVFPRWRERFTCAGVALVVAAAPYVWGIWATRGARHVDWDERAHTFVVHEQPHGQNLFVERVLAYQGTEIVLPNSKNQWLWGLRNLVGRAYGAPRRWPEWARVWSDHATQTALVLIVVFALLRRNQRSARELGATVAVSYLLLYGLVDDCATQYFAWSAPLWLCLGLRTGAVLHALAGAFVYGLYAFVSSDLLLGANWSFESHPNWPAWLTWTRDVANIAFVVVACTWFARAIVREIASRRAKAHE